jgi:hypothetical protein
MLELTNTAEKMRKQPATLGIRNNGVSVVKVTDNSLMISSSQTTVLEMLALSLRCSASCLDSDFAFL